MSSDKLKEQREIWKGIQGFLSLERWVLLIFISAVFFFFFFQVAQLCLTLCDPMDYVVRWNSPGQNTRLGSLSLLQGIVPTQGSNPGLPHCRQILYQLSHTGSPRTLEWVAQPFSRGSSQLRNRTRVSCIAGEFFTN